MQKTKVYFQLFLVIIIFLAVIFGSGFYVGDIYNQKKEAEYKNMNKAFFGEYSDITFDSELIEPAESALSQFKRTFVDPLRPVLKFSEDKQSEDLFQDVLRQQFDESYGINSEVDAVDKNIDNADNTTYKIKMTDSELVYLAYSPDYIDGLKKAEQDMIDNGYISDSDKNSFSSLEEIDVFLNLWIDYLYEKGDIGEEKMQNFKYGVNVVLRDMHSIENLLQRKSLIKSDFLKDFYAWHLKILENNLKSNIANSFKRFADVFVAKDVQAGLCYDLPLCYTAAPGTAPGHVYFSPFCSCRGPLKWAGCLSSCRFGTGPAIYNPSLGICGCAG